MIQAIFYRNSETFLKIIKVLNLISTKKLTFLQPYSQELEKKNKIMYKQLSNKNVKSQLKANLTFGNKNSPGNSISAVLRLKLLRNRHFSSMRKDLKKMTSIRNLFQYLQENSLYLGNCFVFPSKIFIHFLNLTIRLCSRRAPGTLKSKSLINCCFMVWKSGSCTVACALLARDSEAADMKVLLIF